jgi:ATP-dependent Clp protease ATP-binding subunit ClpC
MLSDPKRSFRSVLVRVKGAYAGVFLALEVGLHRMVLPKRAESKVPEGDRAHVFVYVLGLRTEIDDEGWKHPSMMPPLAGTAMMRRRGAAAREHDRCKGWCFCRAAAAGGGGSWETIVPRRPRWRRLLFELEGGA